LNATKIEDFCKATKAKIFDFCTASFKKPTVLKEPLVIKKRFALLRLRRSRRKKTSDSFLSKKRSFFKEPSVIKNRRFLKEPKSFAYQKNVVFLKELKEPLIFKKQSFLIKTPFIKKAFA
jgi:hypothetical protein